MISTGKPSIQNKRVNNMIAKNVRNKMQKKILRKIIYRYNMKEGPPSNLGEGPDYLLRSMLNKMLKVT